MNSLRVMFSHGGSSAMGCWNMILMILMFAFSTLDIALDWCNYKDLISEDYNYGLVSGPPSRTELGALLIFSIIGTILYVMESVNMLSMLRNNGYPMFPVLWELGITMILEEIPLCAINLDIVLCRFHQNTPLQIASTVFAILNLVVRFLALNTKEAKEKGIKSAITILYVLLFLQWMTVLVLSGLVWGHGYHQYSRQKIPRPSKHWLDGVSLFLLHDITQQEYNSDKVNLTSKLANQGIPLETPFLVRDLSVVAGLVQSGYSAVYHCNMSAKYIPKECGHVAGSSLVFRFRYMFNPPTKTTPLGDISYRYAVLFPNRDCLPSKKPLTDGWNLYYFHAFLQQVWNRTVGVEVRKPWPGACTMVHPVYDASIDIC